MAPWRGRFLDQLTALLADQRRALRGADQRCDSRNLDEQTHSAGCSSNTVVIIVQDANPPTLDCYDLYFCNDTGECSAAVDLEDWVYAWDDCGPVTLDFSFTGPFGV